MKTYYKIPTIQDCEVIAQWIADENAKKPHMMPVNPDDLFNAIQKYGWTWIYTEQDALAGIIKLIPTTDAIYEWGSLFVMEEFRGKWLSHLLITHILSSYNHLALMCVTNVPQVITTCTHLSQVQVIKTDIKQSVLVAIENGQPLLPDDHVFWNQNFINIAKR